MKIPNLETISPRIVALRAAQAEIQVKKQNLKAECAAIREKIASGDPDDHERAIRELLGEVA